MSLGQGAQTQCFYFPYLGHAFSALGRKEDAIAVWEHGYEHALRKSADLKQLLELEELLTVAKPGKQDITFTSDNHVADPKLSTPVSELRPYIKGKSNETLMQQNKYITSRLFQEQITLFHTKQFPCEYSK